MTPKKQADRYQGGRFEPMVTNGGINGAPYKFTEKKWVKWCYFTPYISEVISPYLYLVGAHLVGFVLRLVTYIYIYTKPVSGI